MLHGGYRRGAGRKKGARNKGTPELKAIVEAFLRKNLPDLEELYQRIKETKPELAVKVLNDWGEYVMPRLARQELTGEGGQPLTFVLDVRKAGD